MATETFGWRPAGPSAQGEITLRTKTVQFGDGYSQAVADGINNVVGSWPLKFVGDRETIQAISDFLDRHGGAKSFYWTPPLRAQGRYRANNYTPGPEAAGVYSLSVTFQEVFAP